MLPESRIIGRLLIENADSDTWTQAIVNDNVLQKRSSVSATRVANYIRSRLVLMDRDLWELIVNGNVMVATQALLAAAIKHSQLLADFMDVSLRDLYTRLEKEVPKNAWDDFLEGCAGRDMDMPEWSQDTRAKLRQTVYLMLTEADYLSDTRSLCLQRVDITPELRSYLVHRNEHQVLKCLEVCQ